MRIVLKLLKVMAGFALACIVGALVQVLYVSTPVELAALPASELPTTAGTTLISVLKAATHIAIFSLAFAFIAAGIAHWLGVHSLGYWLVIGIGIAMLGFFAQYASEVPGQLSILNNYALQSFLTAGFFGGLTYWLIAGRGSRDALVEAAGERTQQRPHIRVEDAPPEVKKGSLAERIALRRERDAKAPVAQGGTAKGTATQRPATQAHTTQAARTTQASSTRHDAADIPPPSPAKAKPAQAEAPSATANAKPPTPQPSGVTQSTAVPVTKSAPSAKPAAPVKPEPAGLIKPDPAATTPPTAPSLPEEKSATAPLAGEKKS